MKLFKYLIATLLIASSIQAQTGVINVIRNDSAATTVQSNNLGNSKISTDLKGIAYVQFSTAQPISGTVAVSSVIPGTGATNLGKAEDVAHQTGDTGVAAWTVQQDASAPIIWTGAQGRYAPISTNATGAVFVAQDQRLQTSDKFGILKLEDAASADGEAGPAVLYVARDPLIASTVSATNDHINPVTDLAGRTIVTYAPYGETWQSCSSAATDTTNTAIKALVASNRIYVTQISCSNTSTVPSQINIKDGTTVIGVGSIGAQSTGGAWGSIYTVPLRGTVGTALNFNMVTTATSTTCCGVGYISVN